ncbi:MAG: type II secretion system secretin GspD [Nitrospirae bacterium]|nr:type II secretion system secretin GspD [Nitrospirota bacterium]
MKKALAIVVLILLVVFPSADFAEEASPSPEIRRPQPLPQSPVPVIPQPQPTVTPSMPLPQDQASGLIKPKAENYVILNFDNANLRDVINTVSSITGENFIVSPGLEGRITIHSVKKIPASEVLSVFGSILEANGMSFVRTGSFYKVIAGSMVKQKPLEVQKGKDAITSEDRPVTRIVPVEYIPVQEATAVLQPLLSQFGSLIPNPRNNLLIINDLASNINRVLSVLKEIDVNAFQNTRMRFFQPKYSDVKTISKELTDIVNALNLGKEGIAIVPLERINGLIVFSPSTSLLDTSEVWIKKLDEAVTAGQNVFVYRIQNVKAETVAAILRTLYETDDAAKPSLTAKPPAPKPPTAKTDEAAGYGKVKVITYEPTNSLVILASPVLFRELEDTIKRLDTYPKAVLIEVVIAEVTLTDDTRFGIQWSLLHNVSIESDSSFTGLARGSADSSLTSFSLPTTAPTLGSGATAGLSYILFKPDKLIAMLHALASRGRVNVLSSPRLLVRDQQEASIDVGAEIPTATGTTTSADTGATLTQNIQYKTVGVKLKIKPSINDEKTVVLDVTQEVSDVQQNNQQVGQFTYPAFTKREVKTSVVVPDKEGLFIGGIIKEKKDKGYQGIPLLSSIPLLGYLFRYTVDTTEKTELVVLLTPHVISSKEEGNAVTNEYLDKIKGLKTSMEKYRKDYEKKPEEDKNENKK